MNRFIGIGLLAFVVSGCGGGSVDDSPDSTTSAEGLWRGLTSNGRSISGLVFDDGSFWVIYSGEENSAVIAGAVQGSGTSNNGSFTSSNAKDFNLEGLVVNDVALNAAYVMKQSFNGTITSNVGQVAFLSSYDANYELTPSLALVAGTYTGAAGTSGGTELATVLISSAGAVTGIGASGCSFTGSVLPRANGNAYDLSITFAGGVCANGSNTVTGVGFLDNSGKQLTGAALNAQRTDGFIFAGAKP